MLEERELESTSVSTSSTSAQHALSLPVCVWYSWCAHTHLSNERRRFKSGCPHQRIHTHFGTAYRSVIAFGKARILTDAAEKTVATRLITMKYAKKEMADMITTELTENYRSSQGSSLVIVEIKVERITGKHREISLPPKK